MKNNLRNNIYLVFFSLLLVLASCKGKDDNSANGGEQYTCSMHPQVVQDKPGLCPICGMDLVRKSRPGEELKITKELSYLLKPTNALVASSIKTVTPVYKSMEVKTEAKGIIAHDTRKISTISARYGGRIEKLYLKYQAKGFVVLAFPSNDFGAQEPGSNEEIKAFCDLKTGKYKTTFPLFSKLNVKQMPKDPVYTFLTEKTENTGVCFLLLSEIALISKKNSFICERKINQLNQFSL